MIHPSRQTTQQTEALHYENFAEVKWTAGDVLTLRPEWTVEEAERWLNRNEKWIQDGMIEHGWQVIENLLPPMGQHPVE